MRLTGLMMVFLMVMACSRPSGKGESDSDSILVAGYHADHDIAMTLRSITDALQMDEPLDTAEYNFEGVLTDGEGRPLYTDIEGTPGEWEISVVRPDEVVIRNLFLGDLLPEHLEEYITGSLDLDKEKILKTSEITPDEIETVVYDMDGVRLKIETRPAVAPNGLEGPLMSITASTRGKI